MPVPEPMQGFLDRNLGMRSRIVFQVKFEDYYSQNFPAEECIGISSGNSMHKAGGECLTWDSCEIPAEEEERVDSQRKDRFEYQFFRIPCIWRQISGDGRGAG